jgi:hypothetical protein
MGLKMVHGFKVHKGKNYSRLDAIDFLLTLSFEGVGLTQKNPQTADFSISKS